jgi:hypothetical protein
MWDCMRGGGSEGVRERRRRGGRGEGGGGRENNPSSKPLDKYNTPIDQHYKQEVMTEASIRKVYRIRMDLLDVVSLY